MWSARFHALTTDVEVSVDEPSVARFVADIVGSYPKARAAAAVRYTIRCSTDAPRVERDGEIVYAAEHVLDLAPMFELELYREVSRRAVDLWLLHAAAFVVGGNAFVMCGPSGAGKSTMTQAVMARGARYLTDEIVAIDAEAQAVGLARPISFERAPLAPLPLGFVLRSYPMRLPSGAIGEHVLLSPPGEAVHEGSAPVAALICLRHAPADPPGLRALGSTVALGRLWEESRSRDARSFEIAARALRRVPAYELVTRDVEGAYADLASLFSGGG